MRTAQRMPRAAFEVHVLVKDPGIPYGLDVIDPAGRVVVSGGIVTGPDSFTVTLPALAAGSYTFRDPVHAPVMTGHLHIGEIAPPGAPPSAVATVP